MKLYYTLPVYSKHLHEKVVPVIHRRPQRIIIPDGYRLSSHHPGFFESTKLYYTKMGCGFRKFICRACKTQLNLGITDRTTTVLSNHAQTCH